MRSVRLDMNVPPIGAGLRNQQHTRDNQKGVRYGSSGDGQRLSNEDESRINKDVYDGRTQLIEAQPPQHMLQKQSQGVVCWERFLPLRSLKVLLVENDDSTRHVVSALLRNCSYEVTAVANGLEAWKILEDLTNHIDLVLTEVDMPSLSGIGLLSKIMNHRTCSNIPVIMMSSNDSMGIVFTCLSKGATDFLVKPIRKNELRNLWQHVWRKCHSSSGSGSGSESGIRTQKSTKSKSVEGLKNDSDSNDEDDNGSIGLNARDGSDNGSGTQSSWSKRAMEIDSPQPMSPWGSQADPPDSTCAQVIHSRAEVIHKTQVPPAATRKRQKLDNVYDNVDICKDLESGTSRHSDLQLKGQCHNVMNTTMGTEKEKPIDLESEGDELEKGKIDLNDEAPTNEFLNADNTILQVDTIGNEVPNHPYSNVSNRAAYDTKEGPCLELSLKQIRSETDIEISAQECNKLRHSDLSAFSRYNKSKISNQAQTGHVGSCSPVDNSSEAAKTESMRNLVSSSSGTPNPRSNGSSNNNDMGSTTNNVSTKPEVVVDRAMPKSTVNNHHSSAFQPVQHGDTSALQPVSGSRANAANQKIQVQHHHHHYHHHHHHVHNSQQQQQLNGDGLSSMDIIAKAPHRAPSDNIFSATTEVNATTEGNATNYGSASGSNNGSGQKGCTGRNGSSTGIDGEGKKVTSDNGEAGPCGTGGGIGGGIGRVVDQDRLAWREAALNKFQQKRKERCFEKKVRYESRKKLADQRPRVRGQFVRQTDDESKRKDKTKDADS